MKKTVLLLFFLLSIHAFSQTAAAAKEVFEKIKKESKTDGNDTTIYNLMDEYYEQNLQAENDEMNPETIEKFRKLASDPETKNRHLLMLFLMYQQHISQTSASGRKPNSDFQIETMKLMKEEIQNVYGKIPATIYIYQYEALEGGERKEEAKTVATQGLKDYPDSVPLKVYTYLNTKDETLKNDLIQHHFNHWMVRQFQIK